MRSTHCHGLVGTSIADHNIASNNHVRAAALDGGEQVGAKQKGQKMKLRHLLFVAATLVVSATHAWAQGNFSDTSMGVRDGPWVSNPGGGKGSRDVNKIIVNVGHFDVWDYGTNFFNVDVLFSNANEPANNSPGGSTEFYAVYRGQLSPDKILGINTKFGPISAINFEFGGDAEGENTQFAPDKKLLVAGPNFNFALPAGFLNIGVHVSKEWNNNGIVGKAVNFSPAPEFEFVWLYALKFTGLPLDFRGFMNIVLPKGKDGFGGNTYTEILARPQLQLDIGTMLLNKPHKPDLYLAVEFWQHKFGNSSQLSGSSEVTPEIGVEYHF
jgi:nucleoside-specific outer membrane channel protein Tsx